ncbi:MAG: hypothetical protein ACP5QR_09715, partial [Rhizomicrobium sp.]
MKGEGQQVHGGEHHGKVLFAVPEIMFEVVAVIFQDVEGLILDFPSGSGAVGDLGDIGFVDPKNRSWSATRLGEVRFFAFWLHQMGA